MANPSVSFPEAGQQHNSLGSHYLILAPLPIATGYPIIPQQINIQGASETALDHGKGNYWGFEFGIRFDITMVLAIFFGVILTHILGAIALKKYYGSFLMAFIKKTPDILPIYLVCVGGAFILMLIFRIISFYKANKQIPLRFNREKRQVFAVVGKEHFIAGWETIIVQVETALLVSPSSAIQHCSLTFQIPDLHTGRQATLTIGYPAEALAIADWEAIRIFMEDGLTTLKQQSQTPNVLALSELAANPQPTADYYQQLMAQYTEGSVEYFYAIKNRNKYRDNKFSYYFWLFCHLVTAWTLPCYIAQWLNNRNYVKRPKELLDWSKPIPHSKWAIPSGALIQQNRQLLASYGKNGINNFKDYFNIIAK